MSNKNKQNQSVGSDSEKTDERINSSGEVFTPMELSTNEEEETRSLPRFLMSFYLNSSEMVNSII